MKSGLAIFLSIMTIYFSSCTISFQNISTHGTATDLVDEDQTTSPDIKATATVPLK